MGVIDPVVTRLQAVLLPSAAMLPCASALQAVRALKLLSPALLEQLLVEGLVLSDSNQSQPRCSNIEAPAAPTH